MTLSKEEILTRMMSAVPATFDKREGSVIHDALAPVAYELSLAYAELWQLYNNTFAGTAEREGLILRAAEIGVSPYTATYAVRQAQFTPANLVVEIGARFNYDDVNFSVTEKVSDGLYNITCEEAGTAGNYGAGTLTPIDYIVGLTSATLLEEVLVYGEEEESTEALRARYFATIPNATLDGNRAQYEKWCRNYAGIGNFRIFSLWNGANTVKVSILNAENGVASQALISGFQEYLDPNSTGLGNGQAPIGAIVTVSTASPRVINVTARVILKAGYEEVVGIEDEINAYFKSIAYTRRAVNYVSMAAIFAANRSVDTAIEIRINGGQVDIALGNEEIAVLGVLAVNVG